MRRPEAIVPAPVAPEFSPSQLAEFLRTRRAAVLNRWRVAIADRPSSEGMSLETLIDHIPDLLDAIAETGEAHRIDNRSRLATETAERHALERLSEGLDLSQVVVELAVLRDCILQEWDEERAPGAARPEVRFLNRSVDRAIAASIDRYTLARDRTLNALDRISAAALEIRRLDDMLQRLLEVMVETTAAVDTGAILLRDEGWLTIRAAVGPLKDREAHGSMPIGHGVCGRVAGEGRPRSLSDNELRQEPPEPFLRIAGLRCAYAVPLVSDGGVVGVAVIGSLSAPEFSEQDRRLFQTMVSRATAGIALHLLQETAETRAAQLEAVIESIPEAVFVGDGRGIRQANKAGLLLLGARTAEEIHQRLHNGVEIRNAASGELVPRDQRPFARALRGETVIEEELALRHSTSGKDVVVRAAAAPVRLGDRITGAVVVGTDVTGHKKAADERQRLLALTQQAVADRDHILAVVSHELRTPLNTIAMAAAVLGDSGADPEIGQKSVASIVRSARRMQRMIQDLLDVNAIQGGRLSLDTRPMEPGPLVQEVVDSFANDALGRGLTLTHEIARDLPLMQADRDRVFQALANLVANALKVTGEGGVVVRARNGEGGVEISVADSGPGITPSVAERVFEPYWRGNNAYKGTGLGLAIARGIVEAHGGRIWVEPSEPGAGAVFAFTVPAA